MLLKTRNRSALLKFFKKAIGPSCSAQKVTIDKSGFNITALERINNLLFIYRLWNLLIKVKQTKYRNDMIEQEHCGVKNIINYALGFKSFEAAEATIVRIECLKKQLKNTRNMPV